MIEEYNEESVNVMDEQERNQKIAHILVEIEEAIRIGFMVQDNNESDNVYIVNKDMKDGEYLSIAKDVIAELFADESEMYDEWEKAFHEYKEKRKEAEKNFVLPKNIFFGKFRKKNDNQ